MKSLLQKSLTRFTICTVIIFILATPLFYLLTKNFYAEDLKEIIDAAQSGVPLPKTDFERDMLAGIVLQFGLIMGVLLVSLILMLKLISKQLWAPFDDTLKRIEHFSLEKGTLPQFTKSNIKEFNRLNSVLTQLIENNLNSYKVQKEFTENASHELQTPLAVFQAKLDLLLQQPELTEQQAEIVQSLYEVSARLTRLNKNLLLLAKIDNRQYTQMELIDVTQIIEKVLPLLNGFTQGITIRKDIQVASLTIQANRTLLESLINNLIVNAVRHNTNNGEIFIIIKPNQLILSNTSSEGILDKELLFERFHRASEKVKGNGLGLAIAKAICNLHGWEIEYQYKTCMHEFIVIFPD
ncbi:HAMP domain-containing sensor histidine kinase [uncultured Bacteroides sp.]|uniref:sensor histidine kinase n=1 Tax=uncultured Bacteroides sp. TaxID=162156 RepID=UPI002AAAFB5E|nr:HAMP domain-containing sensor histidine kinase [uncultured Bacteroides sp.]